MLVLALACHATSDGVRRAPSDPEEPSTSSTTSSSSTCPDGPGSACDPFPIAAFPYEDTRDTRDSPHVAVDTYGCATDIDESGPEWWYTFTIGHRGTVVATIDEVDGDEVDVDVHLLGSADPDDCLDRDHVAVAAVLEPGTYRIVVDTWVDDAGVAQAGPYTLTVSYTALAGGPCATVPTDVRMFWTACDPSIADCRAEGGEIVLATPTVGPVVKEAHVVTDADGFGGSWPISLTDGIDRHYAESEAATGYVMDRTEPWAPAGEGGSEYGQGATGAVLPVVAEAFYVNMYWRDRPDAGTRMIVRNPANGRAVVAAAGYETGPGANDAIGGVTEEIHDWLGTAHRDDLELGFAADPTLPYGPIDCE